MLGTDLCSPWTHIKCADGRRPWEVSGGRGPQTPMWDVFGGLRPDGSAASGPTSPPSVTKPSGYTYCPLYHFLFLNLIQLIIYMIFKRLDCFSGSSSSSQLLVLPGTEGFTSVFASQHMAVSLEGTPSLHRFPDT